MNTSQTSRSRLDQALDRAGASRRMGRMLIRLFTGLQWMLWIALGLIFADAVLGLPVWVRLGIDVVILAGLITSAGAWLMLWGKEQIDARRVAGLLEQKLGLSASVLLNAVELAGETASGSTELRLLAVERGRSAVEKVEPAALFDRAGVNRSLKKLGAALAVVVLASVLAPRVMGMVVPRYLWPMGDWPAYTPLDFHVETDPVRLYAGQDAQIRVQITGPWVPQKASVVFPHNPADSRRQPMAPLGEGWFVLPLQKVRDSCTFYIESPRGRSRRHELLVLPIPRFEQVRARIIYPAYTGWGELNLEVGVQTLKGLAGSTIELAARSNLPLKSGLLKLRPVQSETSADQEHVFEPVSEDAFAVRGAFTLDRSGSFELSLQSDRGISSDTPWVGSLQAVEDRPPQVQLLEPDLRVIAPEDWAVPLTVSAFDDVAVEKIILNLRRNDGENVQTQLPLEQRKPSQATGSIKIDLQAIGARAGDQVIGYATAFDNRPPVTQASDSATFTIQVVSRTEYEDMARQEIRTEQILAEIEALLEARDALEEKMASLADQLQDLADRLEAAGGQWSPEDRQKQQELKEALEKLGDDMQKLAGQMQQRADQPPLYEFEKQVQQALREGAQRASESAQASRQAGEKTAQPGATPQDLDEAARLLRERLPMDPAADALRQQVQDLKLLDLADKMMAETEEIIAIADAQKELAEKMAAYRSLSELTGEQAQHLNDLGLQQDELRERLSESLKRLDAAADEAQGKLPKMSASAKDLVRQIEELKVDLDQRSAAEAAAQKQGGPAHAHAAEAAAKLQALISQCKSMGEQAAGDLDGALGLSRPGLIQCLSQLAQGRRRGSGSGQGSGGQSGGSLSDSSSQGGGKYNGQTLSGPHSRASRSSSAANRSVKAREGSFAGVGGQDLSEEGQSAEVIEAGISAEQARRAGLGTGGIPLRYRGLSEHYLKRLAEDSARGVRER